jgi:hypothetical protein
MSANGLSGALGRRPARGAELCVQRRGIGVEAETDLAAPLLDEGGEPVGKRRRQRDRP